MRRIIAALTVIAFMGSASMAFAQSNDTPESQFIDFDEYLVNGQVVAPQVQRHRAVDAVNFDRLHELERSFMPELKQSAKASSLDR